MSGGVDSAVAAARAVDAGHDVTGVHLALARNPQTYRTGARGCCTLEDARDARRAADVIGIPFYVWDMAERVPRRRGRRLRRRVRGRPHAQPVPALQREDQVRGGAGPGGGAGLRRGGHRPPRPARRRTACCAAASTRPRTSRTCWRCSPARSSTGRCSRSATRPRRRCAPRRRARGLAVADKPDSHDICFIADGDTRGFLRRAARRGAGRHRRRGAPARCSASTTARTRYTVGQRKGLDLTGPAPDGRPRYVLSITPVTNTVTRRPGRGARGVHRGRRPSGVDGRRAAAGPVECEVQLRAHGEPLPAVVDARRRPADARRCAGRCAASRPARPSWPTGPTRPATSCSGRPPSRLPSRAR